MQQRQQKQETHLDLYHSRSFQSFQNQFIIKSANEKFLDQLQKQDSLNKYLQLIPFQLEKFFNWHKKQFVVKLELIPEANQYQLSCLNNDGIFQKRVDIENVIPVIFSDYLHSSRRKLFEMPLFLDDEMIYFNTVQNEFYIFDKEGQWNEQNTSHELLTVQARYDERKWHDYLRII